MINEVNNSGDIDYTDTSELYLSSHAGTTRFWPGGLDDVRIYNYALTAEQVKTEYNSGAVSFR